MSSEELTIVPWVLKKKNTYVDTTMLLCRASVYLVNSISVIQMHFMFLLVNIVGCYNFVLCQMKLLYVAVLFSC